MAVAAAAAKSLQSCPTLCDPRDGSPPGSPVPGILQAGTLEWVAISFSSAWKSKVKVKSPSHVWLLATPRTAAYQVPLSVGFSRREYWSGVPLPSPIDGCRRGNFLVRHFTNQSRRSLLDQVVLDLTRMLPGIAPGDVFINTANIKVERVEGKASSAQFFQMQTLNRIDLLSLNDESSIKITPTVHRNNLGSR